MQSEVHRFQSEVHAIPPIFDLNTRVETLISEASFETGTVLASLSDTVVSRIHDINVRYCQLVDHDSFRTNTILYLQRAVTISKNYWAGLAYLVAYQGHQYSWIRCAGEEGIQCCTLTSGSLFSVTRSQRGNLHRIY